MNQCSANPSTLDRANCPERGNTDPLLPVGVPREVPEGSVSELRTLRGAESYPVPNWRLCRNATHEFRAKSSTLDQANCPERGNTITPSCGFPQKSFPPEGPHDFRGHLRRSRKSDIAAEENSSADYATCRHAPRPKGEQRARGCVLCELRSALTRSAPVAPPLRIRVRRF